MSSSSRRTAKVAQAVLEAVSTEILFGLKDPRVKNVTVTHVEVSRDMRNARIYISVMGDEKIQSLCVHGLKSARGFLQSKVADRLQTRYTPVLKFILEQGVKQSFQASQLIRDTLFEGDTGEEHDQECDTSVDSDSGRISTA
jgi:ribosome-binding factor A